MKPRRRTSIRRRLLWLSTLVSLLTLGVAGGLFMVHDLGMLRRQMVRDLEVLSAVVGDSCLGALAFDVPETAEKILMNLRHEYQIRQAILYEATGQPFARYQRDPEPAPDAPRLNDAGVLVDVSLFGLGTVEVRRDLILDDQILGQIVIQARTDELAAQLRRYTRIAVLLLLATLAVSLTLARRLQRRIADPIQRLAARTREISVAGNYAPRPALPEADDELTDLYLGFNAMLDQIERREQDLERIRASLEQRVAERTRDLDILVREQRLMLEALPLGVLHLVERRIVRINPRVTELFGWSTSEILGSSVAPFYADPADFAEVGRLGYAHMSAGDVYRTDRLLRRKDGSCFWGRLIGQAIDPSDERLGSLWILDDIDLDKALERRLQQALDERSQQLRAANRELRQANDRLRRLAMEVSLIEEREKRRLAGELHDSPMQKLNLAQMQIASAARRRDSESDRLLEVGQELMREALQELRTLQFELSPPVLYQGGLGAALRWFARYTRAIALCSFPIVFAEQ